jgi:hypothetical protein
MTKKQKKRVGPTHRVREHDTHDVFPLDVYEALTVFSALVFIGGGAFFMYYLSGTV